MSASWIGTGGPKWEAVREIQCALDDTLSQDPHERGKAVLKHVGVAQRFQSVGKARRS